MSKRHVIVIGAVVLVAAAALLTFLLLVRSHRSPSSCAPLPKSAAPPDRALTARLILPSHRLGGGTTVTAQVVLANSSDHEVEFDSGSPEYAFIVRDSRIRGGHQGPVTGVGLRALVPAHGQLSLPMLLELMTCGSGRFEGNGLYKPPKPLRPGSYKVVGALDSGATYWLLPPQLVQVVADKDELAHYHCEWRFHDFCDRVGGVWRRAAQRPLVKVGCAATSVPTSVADVTEWTDGEAPRLPCEAPRRAIWARVRKTVGGDGLA